MKLIVTRIEPTLVLVLGSVLLALLIAVPLATLAARNKGGWVDNLIRVFTTVGLGMPAFWLGLMLILLLERAVGLVPGIRLRPHLARQGAPYGLAVPDHCPGAVGGAGAQPACEHADGVAGRPRHRRSGTRVCQKPRYFAGMYCPIPWCRRSTCWR